MMTDSTTICFLILPCFHYTVLHFTCGYNLFVSINNLNSEERYNQHSIFQNGIDHILKLCHLVEKPTQWENGTGEANKIFNKKIEMPYAKQPANNKLFLFVGCTSYSITLHQEYLQSSMSFLNLVCNFDKTDIWRYLHNWERSLEVINTWRHYR